MPSFEINHNIVYSHIIIGYIMSFITFENVLILSFLLSFWFFVIELFFNDYFFKSYLKKYKMIQKSKEAHHKKIKKNKYQSFANKASIDFKSEEIENNIVNKMVSSYTNYEKSIAKMRTCYYHKPFSFRIKMIWLFRGNRGKTFKEVSTILKQNNYFE